MADDEPCHFAPQWVLEDSGASLTAARGRPLAAMGRAVEAAPAARRASRPARPAGAFDTPAGGPALRRRRSGSPANERGDGYRDCGQYDRNHQQEGSSGVRAPLHEIRRWRRSWGENSGTPPALHAFAIDVLSASAPDPANSGAARSRSSRGPSDCSSASARAGWSSTQRARLVFVVAARSLTRRTLVVVADPCLVDRGDTGARPVEEEQRQAVFGRDEPVDGLDRLGGRRVRLLRLLTRELDGGPGWG